jgi:dihydrofolate synthase/folylpolyglutamate synthase
VSRPSSDVILERMMSLHPKLIDLTLDRVDRLLQATGRPDLALPPVIHFAGTNGKGSTLAMMRAGVEGAGQTAHAYTSPHLARFHERIRVAGELISEDALTQVLDECLARNGEDPITYFEITTVAAFLAFSRTPADWTLLETGLGGRLDATNVIEAPRLTVITPVDYDHQQFLGETLTEIAGEKAGILKRGVPCVVGPQHDDSMVVIETRANQLGVPLLAYGQHWHVWEERGRLVFQDECGLLDLPLPNLIGPHQILNAGAAIAGLRHLGLDDIACEAAVTRAEWPARMQRLRRGPLVDLAGEAELWLDGGHNPAGAAALADTLKTLPKRPTHLISGLLRTKDARGYFAELTDVAASVHAIAIEGESATFSAEETAEAAAETGIPVTTSPGVAEALTDILSKTPHARVLICGSLYLAGLVLRENG